MIDTDLKDLAADLTEEENLFSEYGKFDIKHRFSGGGNKIVNTVTVNGKTYAFGSLIDYKDEIEKKRLIKRYAKLSIYKALSKITGVDLPWGSLTGIRPTKLAYQNLEKEGEFHDFFTQTLMVSEEKTALTEEIILAQKNLYEKGKHGEDLFVFIPFCPSRCEYCSFISQDIKGARKLVDKYVETLIYEIKASAKYINKLNSIYVGGGTPVSLSDEDLDRVLTAIDGINTGVEFTVEAGRPDVIMEENLKILKAHGVTRVCVNPQTFNDETLARIGRKHTSSDVIRAMDLVRDKFSVNMDLIAGLRGEDFSVFSDSLRKAIELCPDNITVHTLCVKRGSYLAEKTDDLTAGDVGSCVAHAYKTLKENGYSPYYLYRQKYMAGNLENVGYAKKGKECAFNVDTMEDISNVIACGANAISKRVKNAGERIERYASPKDVKTYIGKVEEILRVKSEFFS